MDSDVQTETKTETDRQDTQKQTETDRETERQTETDRDTDRDRHLQKGAVLRLVPAGLSTYAYKAALPWQRLVQACYHPAQRFSTSGAMILLVQSSSTTSSIQYHKGCSFWGRAYQAVHYKEPARLIPHHIWYHRSSLSEPALRRRQVADFRHCGCCVGL
eukprot:119917-Rhodomonas_salina.1